MPVAGRSDHDCPMIAIGLIFFRRLTAVIPGCRELGVRASAERAEQRPLRTTWADCAIRPASQIAARPERACLVCRDYVTLGIWRRRQKFPVGQRVSIE